MVGFFSKVMVAPASLIKGVHMPLKSFNISFSATFFEVSSEPCETCASSLLAACRRTPLEVARQGRFDSNLVGQSET